MNDRNVIFNLLSFELNDFAIRLNLIEGERKKLDRDLLISALRILNKIANSTANDDNRQLAMITIALIWTHCNEDDKDTLRQIISPILSYIGFSPSNKMMDESLKNNGVYSYYGSYFDKLKIIADELKNKITINGIDYILTEFQHELWDAIGNNKIIGISAPTSAGKSFLLYLKTIELLGEGATKIVYVVPTLSLISQVTTDLSNLLKYHNIRGIDILNSFEDGRENFVYVLTQERAISVFSQESIDSLDLLIIDEIQNIERADSENNDRAKILYDVLMDIRTDVEVGKIILSGPRLKNIGGLSFDIFGEVSEEKKTDVPPVLSLTYSVSKESDTYYINQYSPFSSQPISTPIQNVDLIKGIGASQYNSAFNSYLHCILKKLNDDNNIIFSPTTRQARKSAKEYCEVSPLIANTKLESLSLYLKDSVHKHYELAEFVNYGVAYHTSRTPMHVRKSIEYAVSKSHIKNLFCTTTLMQGVNLPAKNIIIRNPNLFVRKGENSAVLSPYEFANLRGRAGRLLTDFVGRTIVMDENSFESHREQNETLFSNEYKEIKTGYHDLYSRDIDYINERLDNSSLVSTSNSKSIITYIRQIFFRHGADGISRLNNVGIFLDDLYVKKIISGFEDISVPKKIVLQNRYWDPFDLNELYLFMKRTNSHLPSAIFKADLCDVFLSWLKIMRDNFNYYFERYIGQVHDDKFLFGIAKSAEGWVREKSLYEILENRFPTYSNELHENLDKEIDKLTKHVSFGLPMLLKPVADISDSSSIISQIELGLFSDISRHLSNRGVPRETAIKIRKYHTENKLQNLDLNRSMIELNEWEIQHISHLL
ncbi:DEAD/DEAH box helicase [Dickeya oryzae]|uniref:DEAD/DEAH box helicase n=1 Tax=Dickeya oryzae TaxID=1240404 RepID=UPI002096A9C6|nr:DEAD/DEAH box helicase [Dickeya oryzae]MCO7252952.1 DEAD/DEAH box helicase [Dickeya oryzae]